MLQYMETVSQGEAENIRKTIQDLFRQTCILQVKCDPVTLVQRDNPRYQVCLRHREFIADYLSVLDCELVHDPQEHIFRITGDGVMTERMSLMTTKLVILLKMIYRDLIPLPFLQAELEKDLLLCELPLSDFSVVIVLSYSHL